MKAYQFSSTGPVSSVLKLVDIEKPSPGPDESLVRIKASTINPADYKNVAGSFPTTSLPRVPGRDFAGVVEGGQYDGAEVWGTGGTFGFDKDGMQAEYAVIPNKGLAPKPKSLSFEQAAACGVGFLTGAAMLERAGTKAGDNVLVLGSSGAVGSCAVKLCRNMKATAIETSRAEKAGFVNTSSESLVAQTKDLTGSKGVQVVLDTVGDSVLFRKALATLSAGGTYIIITRPRDPKEMYTFDPLGLYRIDASIKGVDSLRIPFEDCVDYLRKMTPSFEAGSLDPPPSIRTVDIKNEKDVLDAYEKVGKGSKEKLVIVMK